MIRKGEDGFVVECDICGGGMDEDGRTDGNVSVFCYKGDAGIFICHYGWARIGDYAVCPKCFKRITRGEVALRFVEQEKAAIDCNQLGNAKAMREALSDACYAMLNFLKTQNGGFDEMANAFDKAKSALSAPPRNCDLFDTKDKAREAFQKLRGHRILADVSLWDDRDEIEALFNWLFAKPKGGTK